MRMIFRDQYYITMDKNKNYLNLIHIKIGLNGQMWLQTSINGYQEEQEYNLLHSTVYVTSDYNIASVIIFKNYPQVTLLANGYPADEEYKEIAVIYIFNII